MKPPRFKFEIVEKLCKAVSQFQRRRSHINRLKQTVSATMADQTAQFLKVCIHSNNHVDKADQTSSTTSYNVLISLVDGLEAPFTKRVGISVRKLADHQFRSIYQLLDSLRQRELIQCIKIAEIYYQTTWSCIDGIQIETGQFAQHFWEGWATVYFFL